MYQNIYPQPCEIVCREGQFSFGKELVMEISMDFSKEKSLSFLAELWKNFTAGICKLTIRKKERVGDFLWKIGNPEPLELQPGMAYAVEVGEKGIAIKADSDISLMYGFYTLLQMLRPVSLKSGEECFAVDCGRIADAPSLGFRCMHFGISLNTNLHTLRKHFRLAAMMKFTHFVIEFYGSLRFDCLHELSWPGAFGKEELKPIFDEARLMGVESYELQKCCS